MAKKFFDLNILVFVNVDELELNFFFFSIYRNDYKEIKVFVICAFISINAGEKET